MTVKTLPAGVTFIVNIKGDPGKPGEKGDTGTLAFVTMETVPADQPASAEMVGPPEYRGVHIKAPRGLPGLNSVPTDEALAAYLGSEDTEAFAAVKRHFMPITYVDLYDFLEPGEKMPNDGVLDAKPLFQRAILAVGDLFAFEGAKVIRIPAGQYRIDSNVNWRPGVGVQGAGRGATKILPYGSAVFGYTPTGWPDDTPFEEVYWSDLTIDCINQESATEAVGIKGVSIRGLKNSRFERVRILNSWATAFGCDFLQDVVFDSCTAIRSGRGNVTFETFGAGFGIGVGNYDVESVTFINCFAGESASSGFFLERIIDIPEGDHHSIGLSMTACTAIGGQDGLHDMGAAALTVTGCQFLENSRAGVYINGGPASGRHGGYDGRISNTVIRGNGVGVLTTLAAVGGYAFANCAITDNIGAGFATGDNAQLGPGWRFLNNEIERNGAGGILLDAPMIDQVEITGNRIRENGVGDGILLTGDAIEPRISGNTIQGHIGAGIRFPGSSRVVWDPFIQDNVVTENSKGWFVNEKITNTPDMVKGNREDAPFTTLTSFFSNPSYEESRSNVSLDSGFTGVQRPLTGGMDGGAFVRLTAGSSGTNTARINRRTSGLSGIYTLSAWVRTKKNSVIRLTGVSRWPSVNRSSHRGGFRGTGEWQRIFAHVLVPVGGTEIDLSVSLDAAEAGDVLDVDQTALTPGTVLWPYWDGGVIPEIGGSVAWTGSPHNSPQVWTLPV